jgi:hypothetical protein
VEVVMSYSETLRKLAQDALDVQNACNLGGVLEGFVRAKEALCGLPENTGTGWLRNHPVMVAWADKVASLTGVQELGSEAATRAFNDLHEIVGRRQNSWPFGVRVDEKLAPDEIRLESRDPEGRLIDSVTRKF